MLIFLKKIILKFDIFMSKKETVAASNSKEKYLHKVADYVH